MDRFLSTGGFHTEQAHDRIAGAVHDREHQPERPTEQQQRPRAGQRNRPRVLERERLRRELTQHHVQERDQRERDYRRDRVHRNPRPDTDRIEEGHEQSRDRRLADPAETEARQRNPQLSRRNRIVEMIDRPLRRGGTAATLGEPEVDLRASHRHEREFRGDEIGVDEDQDSDAEESEHGQA